MYALNMLRVSNFVIIAGYAEFSICCKDSLQHILPFERGYMNILSNIIIYYCLRPNECTCKAKNNENFIVFHMFCPITKN